MAKKIKNENGELEFKIKDYRSDIDKYVKEKVEQETKKNINIKDYKDQIDKYVKERVEIESASQSVKLLKKQLHNKKVSSAIKTLIIFLLLCSIGYGVYYLYEDGYFEENKGVKCSNVLSDDNNKTKKNNDDKPAVVVEEDTLEDLIKEYGYLVENIKFDANSNYTRDFYNGNLTNEIKLYLSYKLIDDNKINADDDSIYFEASDLKKASSKLFDEISLETFKYNNTTFKYFEFKDVFVSNGTPNEEKEITREIIDIKENDDKTVTITCVEGYLNNNKLYNIINNKEVYAYKEGTALNKYKDKLNTISYVFDKEELVSIK